MFHSERTADAYGRGMTDLAVIVVSTNEASWLTPCLRTVYEHAGGARLDVVVVDNDSADDTQALVRRRFPQARVLRCANRGFAHANNRGIMTTSARYVLMLNPDTQIVAGTLGDLVEALDRRPEIGLLGVKQLDSDGQLYPTIRRFPSAPRALGEALGYERWPLRPAWLGERELDLRRYEQDRPCDWMTGAFMLARREALLSAGLLDERFFLFADEPDLCLRIRQAGWTVGHTPSMTIVHHVGKAGVRPRLMAQAAYSRQLYARKHFGRVHRLAFLAALGARYALRSLPLQRGKAADDRRVAARQALRTLCGRAEPPFGLPPGTAIDPSAATGATVAPVASLARDAHDHAAAA
jgi:N-acetylglucosaminyl-diphospho-decaprenol L-rhamnosyltransferase